MNILVTGAGALLGQGILRSLNQISRKITIHTCDPNWQSGGHWLGHFAHTIPPANHNDYLRRLCALIKENKINLLFVGTDVELPVISAKKDQIEAQFDVRIVVANEEVIKIANNKWLTAKFLKDNGFPYPYSVMSSDEEGVKKLQYLDEYPYFAKPVDGARSKGVVKVENKNILSEITSYPNNLVIQEFISDDQGEYTSGCLVLGGKAVAVVTLRRDLRDGNTYRAFYDKEFDIYNNQIREVAEKLGVEGPCNFQFRIRNGKPVIFEINARFSGTTPLRSFFGFNEVEAVVNYYNGQTVNIAPVLREGEVLRVWSDIFLPKQEIQRFTQSDSVAHPQAEYFEFKPSQA